MRHIYVSGHRVDVEEPTFWRMTWNIVDSTYELAKGIYGTQWAGLPDASGKFWKGLIHERSFELRDICSQLSEGELKHDLDAIETLLLKLDSIDSEMVLIVAKTFGQPMPQTKEEYRKLKRKFDRVLNKHTDQPWFADDKFRQLQQQSGEVFQQISQIRDRVRQNIDQVLQQFPLDNGADNL